MSLLFDTSIYTFQTSNKSYSAVGSTIYDAVWGVVSWYDNKPILNIQKIERNNIILENSIVNGINETIKEIPKGFKNYKGFSCFLDSILFPLLVTDGYFKQHFLNDIPKCGGNELQNVMKNIVGSDTCEPVIDILKKCDIMKEILNQQQQDDSEFFLKLMELYNLEPTTVSELTYLSPDDSQFFEIYNKAETYSVLKIDINESSSLIDMFQTPDRNIFDEDLPVYEKTGEKMKYSYNIKKILDSDALVFYIKRMSSSTKDRREIPITKMLKKGNKFYVLTVVTVHRGQSIERGHYVSYFKLENDYFLYDDLENDLIPTDWQELLKNASKDCSLLIYYPV
jgi:hypothetical protein